MSRLYDCNTAEEDAQEGRLIRLLWLGIVSLVLTMVGPLSLGMSSVASLPVGLWSVYDGINLYRDIREDPSRTLMRQTLYAGLTIHSICLAVSGFLAFGMGLTVLTYGGLMAMTVVLLSVS